MRIIKALVCLATVGACFGEAGKLTVVEPLTILIEHPANKGSGRLLLRNDSGGAVTLALNVGDFVSKTSTNNGASLGAKVVLSGWTGKDGKAIATPASSLADKDMVAVTIEVSDLWEAGESEAKLYNNGVDIGGVKAVKYKLPFAVKIDTPTPDKPEIAFERGKPTQVILKNDDPVTYVVKWEVIIGSAVVPSCENTTLTPNGPARISIQPPDKWFSSSIAGLFKADIQNGKLLLQFVPTPGAAVPDWPAKSIPFQADLYYYSQRTREIGSVVLLFIILFLGGTVSIVLNYGIPNAFKQLDLKERLRVVGRQLGLLSSLIEPRKRVLLATEQKRLGELLASRVAFSPDFQTVESECRLGAEMLEVRVGRLLDLDAKLQRLRTLAAVEPLPPPTRVRDIELAVRDAADSIMYTTPTQQDLKDLQHSLYLQDINEAIKKVDGLIQKVLDKDEAFESHLKARIQAVVTRFNDPATDATAPPGIQQAIKNLVGLLKRESLDNFPPDRYTALDTVVFKLECIRDYLDIVASGSLTPEEINTSQEDLLERLGPQMWLELRRAHRLLLEIKQKMRPEDLAEAIRTLDIQIEATPSVTPPNTPITLRVRIPGRDDPTLLSATEEVKCIWDFGDGFKASGWIVDHFYVRAPWTKFWQRLWQTVYTVTVTFEDAKGKEIKTPAPKMKKITVKPKLVWLGQRTRLEAMWMLASLTVPFLSLLAGAREQFLKQDVVTGVIVVFLLGFGADSVKNLFKQKTA